MTRLLPGWGFEGISRVLLVRDPLDADVTNDEIVVLAERGPRDDDHPTDFQWLPHDEAVDAVSLASRLAPDAERRLHLFASEKRNGWATVIGEANWSPTDE
jgi:hypothetical protein